MGTAQVCCRGHLRTMMVTGAYHYTATSVARRVGMVPADSKVMIIQAESEFRSLHSDSDLSESWREAYPSVHSPPRTQLETGGPHPLSLPQQPPPHLGDEDAAHVHSARELHAGHVHFEQGAPLRKAKSQLELSTTTGPQQQAVGHPLLTPQHDTRGVMSHTHGWSSHHQLGNYQRPAQSLGFGSRLSHEGPGDHQGPIAAFASPQGHHQGDEGEASGQRPTDNQEASGRAPGQGARAFAPHNWCADQPVIMVDSSALLPNRGRFRNHDNGSIQMHSHCLLMATQGSRRS